MINYYLMSLINYVSRSKGREVGQVILAPTLPPPRRPFVYEDTTNRAFSRVRVPVLHILKSRNEMEQFNISFLFLN